MKDKNGNDLFLLDLVSVAGDDGLWVIKKQQDEQGNVEIQNLASGRKLSRHPSGLEFFGGI